MDTRPPALPGLEPEPLPIGEESGVQDANRHCPVQSPTAGFLGPQEPVQGRRFTDAELAAEHWLACWFWEREVSAEDGYEGGARARRLQGVAEILYRFAVCPDFDEVQPWLPATGPGRRAVHCPACGRYSRLTGDGLADCVKHGVQEVAFA